MRIIPAAFMVLVLAACGSSAASHSQTTHTATPAASAAHVRTYPEEAADQALCNTFSTDMANGDTYDVGVALQNAQGTVSPKLANDVSVVVNNPGSLQQDLKNQITVTFDCALVKNGVQPH